MAPLGFLLSERPAPVVAEDLASFWRATRFARERFPAPIDRALAQGYLSDRVGFAFAAGYQAALHALVPSLGSDAIASLCVTEEAGNHPRSIKTRMDPEEGGFAITGAKKWSTLGPVADTLVVIATEGTDELGRPRLRAVRIPRDARNLVVREMPPTPFVPEIPHAELSLEGVWVSADDLLPGDGYTVYTKAFRTIEDLHVSAAILGYAVSAAMRYRFPEALLERMVASCLTARALSGQGPRHSETHVALAGWLAQLTAIWTDAEPSWAMASDAERERWYRDRVLLQVASKAREQRRARAWQVLNGAGEEPPRESESP